MTRIDAPIPSRYFPDDEPNLARMVGARLVADINTGRAVLEFTGNPEGTDRIPAWAHAFLPAAYVRQQEFRARVREGAALPSLAALVAYYEEHNFNFVVIDGPTQGLFPTGVHTLVLSRNPWGQPVFSLWDGCQNISWWYVDMVPGLGLLIGPWAIQLPVLPAEDAEDMYLDGRFILERPYEEYRGGLWVLPDGEYARWYINLWALVWGERERPAPTPVEAFIEEIKKVEFDLRSLEERIGAIYFTVDGIPVHCDEAIVAARHGQRAFVRFEFGGEFSLEPKALSRVIVEIRTGGIVDVLEALLEVIRQ